MSRYFFHYYDGQERVDEIGTECATIREVRLHTLDMATTIVSAAVIQSEICCIEAMNEDGLVIGAVDLGAKSATDYRM